MKTLFVKIVAKISHYRRSIYEMFGNPRFSMPAYDNLDSKLAQYLPEQGFFIEVGAYDGYTTSNTYYLEKIKRWKGILVEPISGLAQVCHKLRSSPVFNCALVSSAYSETVVNITYADIVSMIEGGLDEHTATAQLNAVSRYTQIEKLQVPARTLSSILDESHISEVDFFSLDVEGYELQVLSGIDWSRHQIDFILVELLTDCARKDVSFFLEELGYTMLSQLTPRDFLFRHKRSLN